MEDRDRIAKLWNEYIRIVLPQYKNLEKERREDIIGTPFCITVDDDTINNNTVTIRNRDTMKQDTVKLEEIEKYIQEKIIF